MRKKLLPHAFVKFNKKTLEDEKIKELSRKRIMVLSFIFVAMFLLIWGRLYAVQIQNHDKYANLWEQSKVKVIEPAIRGDILDSTGETIYALSKTTGKSLYIIPNMVSSEMRAELAQKIGSILNKDPQELYAKWKRYEKKKFMWISRKVDDDEVKALEEVVKDYGVLGFRNETERMYPFNDMLAAAVGFCDIDNNGLAGIENKFESKLAGTAGYKIRIKDARGIRISDDELECVDAKKGADVYLTINNPVQEIVYEELKTAMEQWKPKSASAIVLDPKTGEILAIESLPSYDSNNPGASKMENLKIRAITDAYEPGSVMKPLIMMAAMQEGKMDYHDMESTIFCENGAFTIRKEQNGRVNRRTIHDVHHYGHLTYQGVLIKSSNCGMAKVGLMLGWSNMERYLKEYGFGQKCGFPLPGEIGGIMPPRERLPELMTIPSVSMGHAISVTPLQMLMSFSTIANDGYLLKPRLIKKIVNSDGKTIFESEREVVREVIKDKGITKWMRETLALVCRKGGTASMANLDEYGISIGGKTGTAEKVVNGRYSSQYKVCSFVAIAPTDDPKIAIIVMVDEPTVHHKNMTFYGGTVAAPIVKNIVLRTIKLLENSK